MRDLCQDIDGCWINLQMVNWAANMPGQIASREVRVHISERDGTFWRAHGPGWFEFDGQQTDLVSNEFNAWDCYFTDAETSTNSNNGRRDNFQGFGLLNARGGDYPDDLTFCRVVVSD
ncbi:MAG: hypothetical protein AAB693_00120 [Patescibacteria group bacterium]